MMQNHKGNMTVVLNVSVPLLAEKQRVDGGSNS
jgi:hypothetical protein